MIFVGNSVVWDPEQYVRGNYFQKQVSDLFQKNLKIKPYGSILDIGCGDGQYIHSLAQQLKHGTILGIDNSEDMVQHANQYWACDNLSFETHNIEEFQSPLSFDFILSYWCLHWTNINLAFPNIFQSLKDGGRLYAVFSSFSDNSILQTWQELVKHNRFTELLNPYVNDTAPSHNYFYRVTNIITQLPFKQVQLHVKTIRIPLPNIDFFKNLLLTMPFAKRFPADIIDELIEEMLRTFENMCQRKYNGTLYYETRPIFLEATK